MNIDGLIKLFERLKTARTTWEPHWQQLAEHFMPAKANITVKRTPGMKLPADKYDSTAVDSLQVFAAGLHSYLTNPSMKWFTLSMKNKELLEYQDVKEWLKDAEDIAFAALNNSNFNQQMPQIYMDFGCLGTPCLYLEEDVEQDIRFFTRPISEIFIMENSKGIVDRLFRLCSFTARQAFGKWGKSLGPEILAALDAGKYDQEFEFLHHVEPRGEYNPYKRDALNKPFSSQYIELKTRREISSSGYDEFPFFTPRNIKITNQPYAYSQATVALPDVKTLNAIAKTMLKGGQKMVDPPIIIDNDGFLSIFKTTASAINVRSDPEAKVEVMNFKGNLLVGLEMLEGYRQQVKRALFVDLFLILANHENMTATEVRQRVNEKMLILGPILGRLMNELLDPLIYRTLAILSRAGKLPPVPDILRGEDNKGEEYKIVYVSPLARAQKLTEAQSINEFMLSLGEMAKVNQEVIDIFNFDEAGRELGTAFNIPANILRSDEEVQKLRDLRREAMAEQQQLEEIAAGAKVAVDATQADKNLKEAEKVVK